MEQNRKIKDIFQEGPIAPEMIGKSIAAHQAKTGIGAHSIFLGQVRADKIGENLVTAIEYSTYKEMALPEMDRIREEIFSKYELTCMHVHHSLGLVKTGEISLFVFTSAPRRKAAIDACAETVERIKKELPVWGKEIFDNDLHQWKSNQ